MKDLKTVGVISAILQKTDSTGKKFIFLQERWKPQSSPTYLGFLEIPAGGIEKYENVYESLKREVKEECGLNVVKIIDDFQSEIYQHSNQKDKSFVFKPFICQQVLETNEGLPWIGFVFLCEVEGEVKINLDEARNPHWVSLEELGEMLQKEPDNFFPLQTPVLKYYLEKQKSA